MDQARRLREMMADHGEDRQKRARVLAVTSGKGGVGKTNLSIALALAAADLGRNAVILDADLGLANVDVILDVQPTHNLSHVISGEIPIEEALTVVSNGLRLLPGAAGLTHMADLTAPEHEFFLRSMDRLERDSELLIIDTGAGIARRTIDFCVASGEVLVVTTPEPTAIADAYAMIKALGQTDPTLELWLTINMAHSRNEADQILDWFRDRPPVAAKLHRVLLRGEEAVEYRLRHMVERGVISQEEADAVLRWYDVMPPALKDLLAQRIHRSPDSRSQGQVRPSQRFQGQDMDRPAFEGRRFDREGQRFNREGSAGRDFRRRGMRDDMPEVARGLEPAGVPSDQVSQ